jgi:uncharacterized protein (TIGR03663 family)
MSKRILSTALIPLIFIAALAFRLPHLDTRPLHNDEAVNAIKVAELWQHGDYRYDPDEYHGPTLHYATLPFLWLSGAKTSAEIPDRVLRLAPVFFGAALVLLLLLFRDVIGNRALLFSALFIAVSPAMVFYSRYFIHEMLLVYFSVLTIGSGWRYTQTRAPKWAVSAGLGVGLMFATKETFVLNIAAITIAGFATTWLSRKPTSFRELRSLVPLRHVALFVGAALLLWLLFFSSFFTKFHGLLDSILTYFPWLKRAGGESPHIHPWYFYLQRLAWFHPIKGPTFSELLILLLALAGAIFSFTRKQSPLLRFLALYTILLTLIYTAISYKTPWCLLQFYWGMIILAGIGAAAIIETFRTPPLRIAVTVLILAATAQLTTQSYRASYLYASDQRNPYAYAQTVPDILNLVTRAEGIARVSPAGFDTIIKVISPESDYWPLPWYLRRFKNIGWYDKLPEDPFAPIIIVSAKLDARLDEKSEKKWIMAGLTELRPRQFFELYVELELWKKYVESLPPQPD